MESAISKLSVSFLALSKAFGAMFVLSLGSSTKKCRQVSLIPIFELVWRKGWRAAEDLDREILASVKGIVSYLGLTQAENVRLYLSSMNSRGLRCRCGTCRGIETARDRMLFIRYTLERLLAWLSLVFSLVELHDSNGREDEVSLERRATRMIRRRGGKTGAGSKSHIYFLMMKTELQATESLCCIYL